MSIVTRLQPIERDLAVLFPDDLDAAGRSKILATYARQALAETEASNRQATGHDTTHETFVDGRKGAALETVRPDGTIVFEFDLVLDIFAWIYEQLVIHAPVLTGRFAESFVFTADGVPADPLAATVPQASEYVFTNSQPYTRKIERGQSPQAPDGVFEGIAVLAARRFSNIASIKYSFRSLTAGAVHDWSKRTSLGRRRNQSVQARADWLTRQPAIVIAVR